MVLVHYVDAFLRAGPSGCAVIWLGGGELSRWTHDGTLNLSAACQAGQAKAGSCRSPCGVRVRLHEIQDFLSDSDGDGGRSRV